MVTMSRTTLIQLRFGDPQKRSTYAAPAFLPAQSNTQKQSCNGKADHPQQSCDPVPDFVPDVKDGSHRFANPGKDEKPKAHFACSAVDLVPDGHRQRPGADAPA